MERAYCLMGIVNVTPDSFSDGGAYMDPETAVAHGLELVGQGAGILDVGGESTRPGAEPVGLDEELRRVVPVVEGLAGGLAKEGHSAQAGAANGPPAGEVGAGGKGPGCVTGQGAGRVAGRRAGHVIGKEAGRAALPFSSHESEMGTSPPPGEHPPFASKHRVPAAERPSSAGEPFVAEHPPLPPRTGPVVISIDTSKAPVALAALSAGARLVNDVTALRGDPQMAAVVAETGCDCCLMHMQGEPRTMQREPRYADVVAEVKAFLEERLAYAVAAGIPEERVLLDPGIGFGKTRAHNFELLRRLDELVALGRPVVVGTSRKSFLGRAAADARGASGPTPAEMRLPGTIATNVLALERGARVFRVHDVGPLAAALATAAATLAGTWTTSEAKS